MSNRLEMIKQSLRIPYKDDDSLLTSLDSASQEYVGNAVNSESEDFKEDELFINATLLLTQYWYLNRGEAIADHIPVYVTSMIQQLRGKYA
ncbi:phage gp6-like head-tail connector protein [Enterococcus faecalis]|nr:phage gp6-like head-tail connector protein [Enterococcus faecalis]